MSKILPASCVSNVVTIEANAISVSEILSQGVKASEGVALLEGDVVTYITSNAEDIKDVLTQLDDLLTKLTNTLTLMDAALLTPGAGTAGILQITAAQTILTAMKDNLK